VIESVRAGNLHDRACLNGFDGLDLELLAEINLLLDTLTSLTHTTAETDPGA
jgi:hypothetical protein